MDSLPKQRDELQATACPDNMPGLTVHCGSENRRHGEDVVYRRQGTGFLVVKMTTNVHLCHQPLVERAISMEKFRETKKVLTNYWGFVFWIMIMYWGNPLSYLWLVVQTLGQQCTILCEYMHSNDMTGQDADVTGLSHSPAWFGLTSI